MVAGLIGVGTSFLPPLVRGGRGLRRRVKAGDIFRNIRPSEDATPVETDFDNAEIATRRAVVPIEAVLWESD